MWKEPYIKICCISSVEEARMAVEAGVSAVGLVSEMPSGPGVIDEPLIVEIARAVPPPVATFLLTSRQDAASIAGQHARCRTSVIQLVDSLEAGELLRLRTLLPGVKLVQVVHVRGEESVREAVSAACYVDALLLDSGNQSLPVKELGGTGRTHDWAVSARIRREANVPVFLAGGIGEHNVDRAIEEVAPFGLDLCSSVRENGKLSETRLHSFMRAVRMAAG